MKKIVFVLAILIALSALFIDWHSPKTTSRHHEADHYDRFFHYIAIRKVLPELCEQVSPFAYAAAGWGGTGKQIVLYRSDCYDVIAYNTRNDTLCSKVQPINTWFLNGSGATPQSCRTSVATLPSSGGATLGPGSLSTQDMEFFLNAMSINYAADTVYRAEEEQYGKEYALDSYWAKAEKTPTFDDLARQIQNPNR